MLKMSRKKTSSPDITKLKEDLDHIYKTVYHGNGSPSLTNQVTKLDGKITSLKDTVESKFQRSYFTVQFSDLISRAIRLKFI